MSTAIESRSNALELLTELVRKTEDPTVQVAVAKAIVDLQMQMERFNWEREERQAKIDFDAALNDCQLKIGRIAPNQKRADTHSEWADYVQIDRAIRPIYTGAGFSISYSQGESPIAGKVRHIAHLSRGGVTRDFPREITPSTVGPKGNAMATPTDADAIAASRIKRYLVCDIFNISIGIDAQEKNAVAEPDLVDRLTWISEARDLKDLQTIFSSAYKWAQAAGDKKAMGELIQAKDAKKEALRASR